MYCCNATLWTLSSEWLYSVNPKQIPVPKKVAVHVWSLSENMKTAVWLKIPLFRILGWICCRFYLQISSFKICSGLQKQASWWDSTNLTHMLQNCSTCKLTCSADSNICSRSISVADFSKGNLLCTLTGVGSTASFLQWVRTIKSTPNLLFCWSTAENLQQNRPPWTYP